MSTNTLSPRDIRMENRSKKRNSTDALWAFSGGSSSRDLDDEAPARSIPRVSSEVALAAEENASQPTKTGPALEEDDFLCDSDVAAEAKEDNLLATVSSDEEEDLVGEHGDLFSTPPPPNREAGEVDIDDKKTTTLKENHERIAREVVMPASITTARQKQVWFLALSWEHCNTKNPSNKKLKIVDQMELAIWHKARELLRKKKAANLWHPI